MHKDYYKILGVDKSASEEDIKKAFRKLAHQHHPDKHGGNADKFKEANEAYQVLGDKKKRQAYDQFGTADFSGFGGSPFEGSWSGGNPFGNGYVDMGDLSDIFDTFFGGMGGARRRTYQRGSDIETAIEISLDEAFQGTMKRTVFRTLIVCDICKGKGGDPAAGYETCKTCNGRGEIQEERKTFFGSFAQVKACAKCHGKGQIPKKMCAKCKGDGRVLGERSADIEILPGMPDGQVIQLKGFGEAGEAGTATGDLYVRVRVKPHAIFNRQGDDLVIKHELKMRELILGKTISVPTIEGGKAEFEIPAHYDLKQPFRIKGKGMPRFGSFGRGELLVDFILKAPKKPGSKERKILEDLDLG